MLNIKKRNIRDFPIDARVDPKDKIMVLSTETGNAGWILAENFQTEGKHLVSIEYVAATGKMATMKANLSDGKYLLFDMPIAGGIKGVASKQYIDHTTLLVEMESGNIESIKIPHGKPGMKGEKGDPGAKGEPGEKGEPFRYSDFTAEQLERLRGPEGRPGRDGTGSGDMTKADYDKDNDGKVDVAKTAESVEWSGIQNKPEFFGPDGKFLPSKMPDIAINNTFTANSQAAMLALKAEVGDMCIRSDLADAFFVLVGANPKTLSNWKKMSVDLSPYYNKQEVNGLLNGKASSTHNHDGVYARLDSDNILSGQQTINGDNHFVIINNNGTGASGIRYKRNGVDAYTTALIGGNKLVFSRFNQNGEWNGDTLLLTENGNVVVNNQNWTNEWQDFTPKAVGGSGGEATEISGKFRYKIIGKICFCEWNFSFKKHTLAGRVRIALPVASKNGGEIAINAILGTHGTKPSTQLDFPVLQGDTVEWLGGLWMASDWNKYPSDTRIGTTGSIAYEII